MKRMLKRPVAILLTLAMLTAMFVMGTVSAYADDGISIQYAALESPGANPMNSMYAPDGAGSVEGTVNGRGPYLSTKIHKEGFSAARQDLTTDCSQFSFVLYCSANQDQAVDVTGTEYITLWFYCEDADVLNQAGSVGVLLNDGAIGGDGKYANINNWTTNVGTGGTIQDSHAQYTYINGWNFVVYKVTDLSTTGISSLAFNVTGIGASVEQAVVLDDIRFMNKVAVDRVATDNLNEMIASLPALDALTANEANLISSCRKTYDMLSDSYKSQVVGYEKLTACEEKIVGLQRAVDATAVDEKINDIGTVTLKSLSKINIAERAYDQFIADYGEEFKSNITKYDALVAARQKYSTLKLEDLIDKIPQGEVNDTNSSSVKNALDKAKVALDALIENYGEAVTGTVSNYAAYTERQKAYDDFVNGGAVTGIYGNLNDDEKVDASDALIALQIAVNKVEATEVQLKLGDVSNDGKVDATDALLILQKAVNKIEKFPVEEAAE